MLRIIGKNYIIQKGASGRVNNTPFKLYLPQLVMQKSHYANMSVQYTAIFHGCKNVNFQMKNYNIFLIFAQNIDCGYT